MLNVAFLATAASALADVHYVDVNGTNATPPYTNWATAATDIQAAVSAAVAGDEIVVTNGTYSPVVVGTPLNVRSVNGPQFAVIDGHDFVRCVYLTNGASLSGFTMAHGLASQGGGAYGGTLNNCTLIGNGGHDGGGASYCTLYNCTLSNNRADTGGGASDCTLYSCTLTGNYAGPGDLSVSDYDGGGAYYSMLYNCTLAGNRAVVSGGGASACTLYNCTLTGNRADSAQALPAIMVPAAGRIPAN
jgi:hypothetical protein